MASSQALPEPMNSSPHHSKVKVTITLADPTFVAGTHVSGKLEMECRADKGLGIGIMMIELFAVQELSSRDHSATSTFLHSRRLFQGPGLPPSNAVQAHPMPGDPPLPQDYHQARRGRSTFLFRIPIPTSSPSSISFGSGLAKVSYELRASVGVFWKNEKRLVIDKRPIDVVEAYLYDDVLMGKVPESIVIGENGKLWMQGKIVGNVILAGESACLELQVKNHSNKKASLTLTLTRTLYLQSSATGPRQAPVQISDTLTTVPFRGPEYIIPPGAEGVANLVFDIPKHARGVRGGTLDGEEAEGGTGPRHTESLFEIKCKVEVKLAMGMGSKDLLLEIPIDIVHPSAMPAQLHLPQVTGPYVQPYSPPREAALAPAPYAEYNPYYPIHPMSPGPHIPYVDPVHNQVWMPPPPPPLIPLSQSPIGYPPYLQSHSPISQEAYQQPMHPYALPVAPQPYYPLDVIPPQPHLLSPVDDFGGYIPRPSSVGPVASASQTAPPLIPGLPPPPAATSLLPLHDLQHPHTHPHALDPPSQPYKPEVGKGDRALRVSRHLRMSSRNRSVSPQSHRYPLPVHLVPITEASGGGRDTSSVGATAGLSPATSNNGKKQPRMLPPPPLLLHAQNMPLVSPTHSADGVVHSPRPQLTPKHSFTRDPVNGDTVKSERVETLEKMADEVGRKSQDLSCDLPKGISDILAAKAKENEEQEEKRDGLPAQSGSNDADVNKTLPGPPVPSGKNLMQPLPSRARADVYFAEQQQEQQLLIPETSPLPSDQTPPTPALVAVLPSRQIRSQENSALQTESGLDALERRLLAEVGTRKLDTRRAGKDKRPGVRDVLVGAATPSSADTEAEVESIASPPSRAGGVAIPAKSPETLHDSAISSLTLAGGLGGDESDGEFDGRTHKAGRSRAGSSDGREGGVAGPSTGLHQHMRERAQVSTPTKTLNLDRVRSRPLEQENLNELDNLNLNGSGKSRETKSSGKKKERASNKSAAKGRVAAWLGGIDPDVPPQEQIIPPSPSVTRKTPSPFQMGDDEPAPVEIPSLPDDEPQQVSASPNPRSSGFVPISTLKKEPLQSRPLIAGDATVVVEAKRVQDIWSSQDTPVLSAKQIPSYFNNASQQQQQQQPPSGPLKTDRKVTPPSIKPAPPDPRSKPLSYSAAARNVWKLPETVKTPAAQHAPPIPPKPQVLPPPKKPVGRIPAVFPQPKPVDPEVKYDIRSARGGRGGKVTAVANLWSSGAINRNSGKGVVKPVDDVGKVSVPPPVSSPMRTEKKLFSDAVMTPAPSPKRSPAAPARVANTIKPTDAQKRPDSRNAFPESRPISHPMPKKVPSSAALKPSAVHAPLGGMHVGKGNKSSEALVQKRPATAMSSPYSLHAQHGKAPPTSHSTPNSSDPKLHNLVAKGVKPAFKATSDPAVVISSHAVPTLSSTASLARPHSSAAQNDSSRPVKVPPVLATSVPTLSSDLPSGAPRPVSPSKPVDLAFGQARIRDLIKKYQGGQGQKT
ncbi:hypothetical protein JR316_0006440 [Psilocybe cubensis]|uniref:Arrestin C-terminal-like domain-containing protein n=2 Tax=Psilocybe cubensis TaxID=181762 RepID=A0A8H7XME7_PSICU|nr:hypothetical protein JR316_0006440 [Psilocybe cubensis]KAH9481910.1 hypothetical protein JR316_0006440 [Psilocybe cubensis]